jgi:hypothetical protein
VAGSQVLFVKGRLLLQSSVARDGRRESEKKVKKLKRDAKKFKKMMKVLPGIEPGLPEDTDLDQNPE